MPMVTAQDGTKINYDAYGSPDAPPLLLLSGTGHDMTFWNGQIPRLSGKYRCIVIDNRGTGDSDKPAPGYTLKDMADDAMAVLHDSDISKAHVMGFSMGGHIAQELALNYPGHVLSLGLHHTWARNDDRLFAFQSLRKYLAENGEAEALARLSLLNLYAPDYYDAHREDMQHRLAHMLEGMRETLRGWIGQLDACRHGDTHARLGEIHKPTLVTCSDRDVIVPVYLAREIHQAIKGSDLIVLEGTGHVALIEAPEKFATICLEFLQNL